MSISRFVLSVVLLAAASLACAQTWPAKPVKFIVPFPPGGTVDPLARLLGAKLGESLGQQFVVENRPGAGGSLGTGVGARSPADGYTFVFVFDSHAVNPALIPGMPFDTLKDLAPVMLVGTAPYAIVTHVAKPYQSIADVVRASQAKPGSVSIGSIGNGTIGHLVTILAQKAGGFSLTHVPYRGGGPMTQDILGQQVELGIGTVALLSPQVKAGKMRAVAVTGEKRSPVLPDVPTLIEQGLPGVTAIAWWGIVAPAGIPKPIMDRFHAELTKALNLPEVRKTLGANLGMELAVSSPEAMQSFLVSEIGRWARVVRENNVRAD